MKKFLPAILAIFMAPSAFAQDGLTCSTPLPLTELGQYTAEWDNTWYTITIAEDGLYNITFCDLGTCDTKIWVYEDCPPNELGEYAEGTFIYNDDFCNLQANVNFPASVGDTYLIRIGDYLDDCNWPQTWAITNLGEIAGCTDPTMCNYNPLATEDDGSCVTWDDPLCLGPDLRFDEDELIGSLWILDHFAANCDIEEGCVTGYGVRDVIAFSSKIDNIGQQDYYIGNPSTNPNMFNTVNCHGHTHYEGYGDYKLVDMDGNVFPAGHKNGFCVMDLCGSGQYTCSDMGISAGCYDVYGAGTQCQWIDVTEVPDGDYRLVAIVNPLYLPDAVGRVEEDFVNNMTTVCMHIWHDGTGAHYELLDDCPEYVDCAGIVNGNAWPDCAGDCNGSAKWGDVISLGEVDSDDLFYYYNLIAMENDATTTCNDLSGNGSLTIYDLALNHQCQDAVETGLNTLANCSFPTDIINPDPGAGLAISSVDLTMGTIDIEMTSTTQDVLGFQFTIEGVDIAAVSSLMDGNIYDGAPGSNGFTNSVWLYSFNQMNIPNGNDPKNVARIWFSGITGDEICITEVQEIVNSQFERMETYIYGDCVTTVGIAENMGSFDMVVQPNPASEMINVIFTSATPSGMINIYNSIGELVKSVPATSDKINIDLNGLSVGVYMIEAGTLTRKFIKQ